MVVGCPSRLWFGSALGLMVCHTVKDEEEMGFTELVVVEGCGEDFGDGGFIGWGLGGACFRVGKLKENLEVMWG